jgi:selenocysteine-specific elongation factor
VLVATAGHVDHGKTTLVRALTGIDTDRLPEEKRRGLTIDLGFAYRHLDDGTTLGFVDVPGHERFVRNMIAGIPAIDLGLLIVAADDGPMPQTREHLAILDLLGVSRGIVAVTKIDSVSPARALEVIAEARALVAGTGLADAPALGVSAETGEGMAELEHALLRAASASAPRPHGGGFRLAVDRCFTVPGAGVVVTGAVFAGRVALAERLRLVPGDLEVRVRGIRAQDREAEVGRAGERCALNVVGPSVARDAVHRGQWLVTPELATVGTHLDAHLRVLADAPRAVRHWTPVHLHHGAAAVPARVAMLEGHALEPGEEGLVQLVLERPIHAAAGDRLVLRDQSARETLAGGRVIDPLSARRDRSRPARLALLRALDTPVHEEALRHALEVAEDGLAPDAFGRARNLRAGETAALVEAVAAARVETDRGLLLTTRDRLAHAREALLAALDAFHAAHPDALGPDAAVLTMTPATVAGPGLRAGVLRALLREGAVRRAGRALMRADHRPSLPPEDQPLWDKLLGLVGPGVLQPPVITALREPLGLDAAATEAFLERCAARGLVVRAAPNRYLHHRAAATLAAVAEALGHETGRFDARTYRDRAGIGRNFAIDLLEFFDAARLTRRIGDERVILAEAATLFGEGDAEAAEHSG